MGRRRIGRERTSRGRGVTLGVLPSPFDWPMERFAPGDHLCGQLNGQGLGEGPRRCVRLSDIRGLRLGLGSWRYRGGILVSGAAPRLAPPHCLDAWFAYELVKVFARPGSGEGNTRRSVNAYR